MKTLISVLAAACTTAVAAAWTSPPPAYDHVVRITEKTYSPATLEVNFGDKVVWKNFDSEDCTVTAQYWPAPAGQQERPYFDSGVIPSGGSFEFIFVKEGTYRYACRFHPGMTGTITVRR